MSTLVASEDGPTASRACWLGLLTLPLGLARGIAAQLATRSLTYAARAAHEARPPRGRPTRGPG